MLSKFKVTRLGFTLIEVMVAMTLSLLMMLALAATFKLIGDRISKSQSELELSANIREVASTLRGEIRRSTVSDLSPPADLGEGYVVYYEGPMTSQTTSVVEVGRLTPSEQRPTAVASTNYFPETRYGDVDDYLAFTAEAPAGSPFMGYIPYGILAAKVVAEGRGSNASFNFDRDYHIPLRGKPYSDLYSKQLEPFYSEWAEIAYWVSPAWKLTPRLDNQFNPRPDFGTLVYDNQGRPEFRDREGGPNGDALPDKLNLHRRVLLIRDDLNMTLDEIDDANGGNDFPASVGAVKVLPFYDPIKGKIVPLHLATPLAGFIPGDWGINTSDNAPNWMVGLARLQQIMDLSLSRVVNDWDLPNNFNSQFTGNGNSSPPNVTPQRPESDYGMPSPYIRANSLKGDEADVTYPHNRFATVRMPEQELGVTTRKSSTMPLLALCPPHDYILNNRTGDDQKDAERAMPSQADATPVRLAADEKYRKFTLVGFVRPEFNLCDRLFDSNLGVLEVNRGSEDVIATNVLSFDVRAFDPEVPSFVWLGPDGQEGVAGVDDNDDRESSFLNNPKYGPRFDPGELGWVGSDDELLLIDDLNIRRVITQPDLGSVGPIRFELNPIGRGGFVDLNAIRLSGAPFGGSVVDSSLVSNYSNMGLIAAKFASLGSPSTYVHSGPNGGLRLGYSRSIQQAGRFVLPRTTVIAEQGNVNAFYQSTFDTWTKGYWGDGFDQEGLINATWTWPPNQGNGNGGQGNGGQGNGGQGNGNGPPIYPPGQVRKANKDYHPYNAQHITNYLNVDEAVNVSAVSWTNAYDGDLVSSSFSDNGPLRPDGRLQSGSQPIKSRPPIEASLKGIQIQLRVWDPETGEIRQQTIVETF